MKKTHPSYINLTPRGTEAAEIIFKRHEILIEFFQEALGLDGDEMVEQACRIEHAITQETAIRIRNLTHWLRSQTDGKAPGTIDSPDSAN
ncbi:MAG: hypothetical protein B6D68_02810 [spirochete symbiont of Stewartia floridana]|nr:MAG: hypothetical protein B6D68_02810 [spirochete symbiont of Stewartia floridana]